MESPSDFDEHAVALIAERGGAQPRGAVLLIDEPARAEIREHLGDGTTLVQRALRKPRVELHADAVEVVAYAFDGPPITPLTRLLIGRGVTQRHTHLIGHLDEVLPVVAVVGRLLSPVAGEQRRPEVVELAPEVVQVVLAVHLGALCREQVRERVADCDPAPSARVDRPGGVQGHELEVDAVTGPHVAVPVALTLRDDSAQHVVEPRRREIEVDEPRARALDAVDVRRTLGFQRDDDLGRDLARWHPDGLREPHRHVGREVTVACLRGGRQLDALQGGKARRVERAVEGGKELVTDHRSSRAARHGIRRAASPNRSGDVSGCSPRFAGGSARTRERGIVAHGGGVCGKERDAADGRRPR